MGRKTRLTTDVQNRIVDALAIGASRGTAAELSGIGESTFYRWMERGEAATRGQFREFWEAVRSAEVQAEITAIGHWRAAMPRDWRACKEFLERRFPDRWGQKQAFDAQKPVEVYVVREDQLDQEEWERVAQSSIHTSSPGDSS